MLKKNKEHFKEEKKKRLHRNSSHLSSPILLVQTHSFGHMETESQEQLSLAKEPCGQLKLRGSFTKRLKGKMTSWGQSLFI